MTRITHDMLTDWYPADIDPVRVGQYECDRWIPPGRGIPDDPTDSAQRQVVQLFWNGNFWSYECGVKALMYVSQGDCWRGLNREL